MNKNIIIALIIGIILAICFMILKKDTNTIDNSKNYSNINNISSVSGISTYNDTTQSTLSSPAQANTKVLNVN